MSEREGRPDKNGHRSSAKGIPAILLSSLSSDPFTYFFQDCQLAHPANSILRHNNCAAEAELRETAMFTRRPVVWVLLTFDSRILALSERQHLAESRQRRRQLAHRISAIHHGQRKPWLLKLMCGCDQLWTGLLAGFGVESLAGFPSGTGGRFGWNLHSVPPPRGPDDF